MTAAEAYLALLRAALWGTDIPAWEDFAPVFDEALELCDRQKTRGLAYDLLLRSGYPVPAESAGRMQQLLYRILNTHRKQNAALARVVSVLRQAGVPCVLLKGQGVARFYPNPLLRECGDIDLYVGPERLPDAVRATAPLSDKPERSKMNGKHWLMWIGDAEIEFHHTMLPKTRRQSRVFSTIETEGLSDGLVTVEFDGVPVNTPGDTFNAFFLFFHAWQHFLGSGIGLRQLCDWTLLLHERNGCIDRTRLLAMLTRLRLLRPWTIFGCIAVHDLGLPETELPFYDGTRYDQSRRVLDRILLDGNFGMEGHQPGIRPKGYLNGKLYSLGSHFRRFFQLLSIVPGAAFNTLYTLISGGIRRVFKDLFHR